MSSEDPLRALAALPRPRLSPFFAGRVLARGTESAAPRAGSRLMRLYWLVLACVAGTALVGTWAGVAVLLLAAACSAYPGPCARLLLTAAAGLAGRVAGGPGSRRG